MGYLSETVAKTQRRWKGVYIPEWMPSARWAAGILAGIVLFLSLVTAGARNPSSTADTSASGNFPASTTQPAGSAQQSAGGSSSVTSGNADATGPSDAAPGQGSASSSVQLDAYGGNGQVDVPREAARLAEQAVAALFSGDFTDVPIVDGMGAPVTARVWKSAKVEGATAASVSNGSVTILVQVDPDGSGELATREVPVIVVQQGSGWAYLPG